MKRLIPTIVRRFHSDEDGAVTVDWVVLTAAAVGLAIATVYFVRDAATDPADSLSAFLSSQQIKDRF